MRVSEMERALCASQALASAVMLLIRMQEVLCWRTPGGSHDRGRGRSVIGCGTYR